MEQGNRLRQARLAKRMTQQHLADAAAVNARTVLRAEKGGVVADESLRAICSVLELDVESLPPLRVIGPQSMDTETSEGIQDSHGLVIPAGPSRLMDMLPLSERCRTGWKRCSMFACTGLLAMGLTSSARSDQSGLDGQPDPAGSSSRSCSPSLAGLSWGPPVEASCHSGAVVADWAMQSVNQAYRMDFSNYRSQMSQAALPFSGMGWEGFRQSLETTGVFDDVATLAMFVAPTLTQVQEVVMQTKDLEGHRTWEVRIGFSLSSRSQTSSKTRNVLDDVWITEQDGGRGLLITGFSSS
jgi:transcriptional regulator with XRE-family HTH domain